MQCGGSGERGLSFGACAWKQPGAGCALFEVVGMNPPAAKKSKKNPAKELDVSNATRGVWLVKVPNYLADIWKNAQPDSELGKIKITK